jgi:hypothetical protein
VGGAVLTTVTFWLARHEMIYITRSYLGQGRWRVARAEARHVNATSSLLLLYAPLYVLLLHWVGRMCTLQCSGHMPCVTQFLTLPNERGMRVCDEQTFAYVADHKRTASFLYAVHECCTHLNQPAITRHGTEECRNRKTYPICFCLRPPMFSFFLRRLR